MHVISKKALRAFWERQGRARDPLVQWHKVVSRTDFASFPDLKGTFRSVDYVPPFTVFDVGGNNWRIVTAIHYNARRVYIRHVFDHAEYDAWSRAMRKKRK